jgi:hypothetical protein
MKKFKLFALAMLIGTAGLFASELENSNPSNDGMRNEIVQLLKTPDFTVPTEINVTISFTFSSEGELVVLSVDSKNSDVLKYIRKNLNYKKIESPGERDKLYTMPLKLTSA